MVIDAGERTQLHYAALEDDVAAAESRLAAGDDPNASDREGFTPLHLAAQEGASNVARVLLDRGPDVDPVNSFGNTPLFTAVFNYRGPLPTQAKPRHGRPSRPATRRVTGKPSS